MYATGNFEITDIAETLGVGRQTVRTYLREEGYELPQRTRRPNFDAHERRKIRSAYRRSKSIYKVASDFGTNSATVHQIVRDIVPEHRRRRIYSKAQKRRAIRMYNNGASLKDIATAIGCYEPSVYAWLKEQELGNL